MIELKTDLSSKVPIYKQLMEQFEEGVRNGSLKPGEQVMSINAMAASLGISRETAIKVYSKLRARVSTSVTVKTKLRYSRFL